mmetsp:Transcript_9154/g.26990  ORF Transcript_9154/g.26990 Transcript_9154/m.26990 type:complete len:838 (-) Transcript_9154:98-2611(-)
MVAARMPLPEGEAKVCPISLVEVLLQRGTVRASVTVDLKDQLQHAVADARARSQEPGSNHAGGRGPLQACLPAFIFAQASIAELEAQSLGNIDLVRHALQEVGAHYGLATSATDFVLLYEASQFIDSKVACPKHHPAFGQWAKVLPLEGTSESGASCSGNTANRKDATQPQQSVRVGEPKSSPALQRVAQLARDAEAHLKRTTRARDHMSSAGAYRGAGGDGGDGDSVQIGSSPQGLGQGQATLAANLDELQRLTASVQALQEMSINISGDMYCACVMDLDTATSSRSAASAISSTLTAGFQSLTHLFTRAETARGDEEQLRMQCTGAAAMDDVGGGPGVRESLTSEAGLDYLYDPSGDEEGDDDVVYRAFSNELEAVSTSSHDAHSATRAARLPGPRRCAVLQADNLLSDTMAPSGRNSTAPLQPPAHVPQAALVPAHVQEHHTMSSHPSDLQAYTMGSEKAYLEQLEAAARRGVADFERAYAEAKAVHKSSPSFYVFTAHMLRAQAAKRPCVGKLGYASGHASDLSDLSARVLSNCLELRVADAQLMRTVAYGLLASAGRFAPRALVVLERVRELAPSEPQTYLDIALAHFASAIASEINAASIDLPAACACLDKVLLTQWAGRFSEIEVPAIVLLRAIRQLAVRRALPDPIEGLRAQGALGTDAILPRTSLAGGHSGLLVWLSWDTDHTDVDLHIVEPSGTEIYYGNTRSTIGGLISRDFTDGFGPEVYVLPNPVPGEYVVKVKYFSSRQASAATGTTSAVVWTVADAAAAGAPGQGDQPEDPSSDGDSASFQGGHATPEPTVDFRVVRLDVLKQAMVVERIFVKDDGTVTIRG